MRVLRGTPASTCHGHRSARCRRKPQRHTQPQLRHLDPGATLAILLPFHTQPHPRLMRTRLRGVARTRARAGVQGPALVNAWHCRHAAPPALARRRGEAPVRGLALTRAALHVRCHASSQDTWGECRPHCALRSTTWQPTHSACRACAHTGPWHDKHKAGREFGEVWRVWRSLESLEC
jgi:hypothetical protein